MYITWQNLSYFCLLGVIPDNSSEPKTPEQANTIGFRTPVVDAQLDVRGKMDELQRSVSDYFPMIKRGFSDEKEEGAPEVVAMGWKHDVASRKEREEGLR